MTGLDAKTAAIACYDLEFVLDYPQSFVAATGRTISFRYEAAQGIVLGLLRHVDPDRVTALHDANERKALSISPVAIRSLRGGLARARLRLCSWDAELVALADAARRTAMDAHLSLGGRRPY